MNKSSLTDLIKQWWIIKTHLKALNEEQSKVQQLCTKTTARLWELVENIQGHPPRGKSQVFKIKDGVHVLLAWQDYDECHTVELVEEII